MTKTEADDILAYVAQNIIAPLAFNDKPASEVWEDLIGYDFNKLCLFVYGMVQTDKGGKANV